MSIELPFVKMHGAGNDFIVMDARRDGFPFEDIRRRAAEMCHRRTGIGADGILMLGTSSDYDYTMHYMNADGSDAGMCGNGARCLARFAVMQGFGEHLQFQVGSLVYKANVHDSHVAVQFPVQPEPGPVVINERTWLEIHTGTEHVVSIDKENEYLSDASLRMMGKEIRNREDLFPKGTNVNFSHVLNENKLKLITYERGVEDLTLACGTGAIATAIGWHYMRTNQSEKHPSDKRDSPSNEHHIQVECPGGPLEVTFDTSRQNQSCRYNNIVLHGPAVTVFKGTYHV